MAIAERTVAPADWLQPMISAVAETPRPERNYDLLSGYVAGLAQSHPTVVDSFKSLAAESHDLAPSFPLVCAQLGITPSDVQVAIGAIKRHLLSPWRLNSWAHAWKLDQIPDTSLAPLIDALLDHSAEGYGQAAELMSRISHDAGDRLDGFAPQIAKLAANSTRWRVSEARRLRDPVMVSYYFEVIVGRMLAKGRGDPAARATALALAQAVASGVDDTWVKPVLPALLSGFAEIAWPLLGQAALSSEQRHRLGYILGDPISGLRDSNPPLLSLPEDALLAWCHAYPDRAPAFAAQYLPLLTHWKDDDAEIGFHPLMIKLLDEFGCREDVQKAVWTNMHTYGWSGSSATYYTLYEKPLSTLSRHRQPGLRRWAKRTLRGLRHAIDRETRRDQERDVLYDL